MKDYQRILVLGSPGSGKSTLTKKIAEKRQLSIISLDGLFWLDDENTITIEELKTKLVPLLAQERWIMDGNFASILPLRLERSDLVIYLQVPRLIAMYRVIKRYLRYHGKANPSGNPDRLDMEFLRYIWDFPKTQAKLVEQALATHPEITLIKARHSREVFQQLHW